ncbi:glycosyltransferase family 2 protein [Fodinibius sp. Rm-B-1B1-1]|uniref:glycosyltransferase family 2 protein n=1 Tax=Fodinibius alkaliphilus TaxID=3140241 RepID=UPI00315AE521
MSRLPKISIITVSYNAENTIERTIRSVLKQNYEGELEYIIIDGGSTDKTKEIIRKYGDDLKWISENDEGIYDAMNKGIRMATGDWIGILNSDDWYAKNTLNIVGRYAQEKSDINFLIGKMGRVNITGTIGKKVSPPDHQSGILEPNNHPATFVKKDAYLKMGLYNLAYNIASDMELIMRAKQHPQIQMGSIDFLLTYMQEGGISNGFLGSIERFRIEKKYYGLLSAMNVLIKTTLQKTRKSILQTLLPQENFIQLQEGWWDKHRDSFTLSDDDYWM